MREARSRLEAAKEASAGSLRWLEAVAVVAFDVEHGQVVEEAASVSGEALSAAVQRKLCSLALPDSNSGQNGDVQYCFRFREGETPLGAMSAANERFLFCAAFFRQIKDKKLRRGYFQKSVVLVSRHPFVRFLEDCSYIVGPLYFEFGRAVLDAILDNVRSWPRPVPGKTFKLDIAGSTLTTAVPCQFEKMFGMSSSCLSNNNGEVSGASHIKELEHEVLEEDRKRVVPKNNGEVDYSLSQIFQNPRWERIGLFQDVPLFSTFGGLSVALWHIWELALSGEPILVLAPSPDRCSQAVLAIASLIAPIAYRGDFRPYFTIYDSDFMEICRKHDQKKGSGLDPVILGVTNPYFLKSLEYWPNVISMGGPSPSTADLARSATPPPQTDSQGRLSTGASSRNAASREALGEKNFYSRPGWESPPKVLFQKGGAYKVSGGKSGSQTEKEERYHKIIRSSQRLNRVSSSQMLLDPSQQGQSYSVEGRDIKSAKYHPTVVKRGTSLRALLTDQKYERSIILTRDEPMVPPDKNILQQLMTEADADKADLVVLHGENRSMEPPALAVNNALLRKHFNHLTRCFLRPLENYFNLEAVGSRAARHSGINLSAYNEPSLLGEKFNEEGFLQELESQLPEKELRRTNWRVLYRKFIDGPNFLPWYNRQRVKLEYQLEFIYKHLRLNTDSDVLLQAAGVDRSRRERILRAHRQDSGTEQDEKQQEDHEEVEQEEGSADAGAGLTESEMEKLNNRSFRLYVRIKTALDRELAKPEGVRDEDVCNKIQEHLDIVQSLLSHA